ncbi:uncharacterized protein LOC105420984 [Amborella trichopoda]|uniref:uncharacterized protein LOC105420984 n=1 Tax=Amborella trichopoda TaxID=13333 RepID=UPI0005D4203C|nr:uncharacterized protein LOC105420984 [Amborella trichopoda]XP_020524992.1 uncharacterized protein LOC105420984 [Amborella trichopoda]|eukprot:XP_011625019.1 uncharacterized protein LOC105420984 [Amborella trichopoda]
MGTGRGKKPDQFYQYCTRLDGGKLQCNFCGKQTTAGITRMKKHLAARTGDVAICTQVPKDVMLLAIKVLDKLKAEKRARLEDSEYEPIETSNGDDEGTHYIEYHPKEEPLPTPVSIQTPHPTDSSPRSGLYKKLFGHGGSSGATSGVDDMTSSTRGSKGKSKHSRPPRPVVDSSRSRNDRRDDQPMVPNMMSRPSRDSVCELISRMFFDNAIPLSVASSSSFREAMNAIANCGKGFEAPTASEIGGPFLRKEKVRLEESVISHRRSQWKQYGCTLMADSWRDRRGHTLVNFSVYCSSGTTFLRCMDISDNRMTADYISSVFKDVIEYVDPKNIVQIIMDQGPEFKLAERGLAEEYGQIFFGACTAHVIDLILHDLEKFDWVKELIGDGMKISKFVYNHAWILAKFRKLSIGQDLIHSSRTHYATSFIAIRSMVNRMMPLQQLFVDPEWRDSSYSKTELGKNVQKLVMSEGFWKKAKNAVAMVEPLLKILRLVDSDKPTMGYIFDAMCTAKALIKMFLGECRSTNVCKIIDSRWRDQLHSDLHAVAYHLNPYYLFKPSSNIGGNEICYPELAVHTVISRLVPDPTEQARVVIQVGQFSRKLGIMGTDAARIAAQMGSPIDWWSAYGVELGELRSVAIRILSQANASFGCGRNWSIINQIRSKQRNQLAMKRLNDLVFVQYNLRLEQPRSERLKRSRIDPISVEAFLTEDPLTEWIARDDVEPEFPEDLHRLEGIDDQHVMEEPETSAQGNLAASALDTEFPEHWSQAPIYQQPLDPLPEDYFEFDFDQLRIDPGQPDYFRSVMGSDPSQQPYYGSQFDVNEDTTQYE